MQAASAMRPTSVVVVFFPAEPVMPITLQGACSRNTCESLVSGMPRLTASAIRGNSSGTPPEGQTWDTFYAADHQPPDTGVTYSIRGASNEILLTSVISGTDISTLGSVPVRLYAELMSSVPSRTPLINRWCASWQPGAPQNRFIYLPLVTGQ